MIMQINKVLNVKVDEGEIILMQRRLEPMHGSELKVKERKSKTLKLG